MKYRLDEALFHKQTKAIKRFLWVEAYWLSLRDDGNLHEVYTEDYRQIDLIAALKDIANHQINFDPNHRNGLYNS
ncbi:MAG: hypothetical protein ACOYN8_06680 [Pseudanabaena sp.]